MSKRIHPNEIEVGVEDATGWILKHLRSRRPVERYQADLGLVAPMGIRMKTVQGADPDTQPELHETASPVSQDAEWALCRRGILRPPAGTCRRRFS